MHAEIIPLCILRELLKEPPPGHPRYDGRSAQRKRIQALLGGQPPSVWFLARRLLKAQWNRASVGHAS